MKARDGDLVIVHGSQVGRRRRTGRIVEVLIGAGTEHYRVRWDSGEETIYFPQADCTIVPAGEWKQAASLQGASGDTAAMADSRAVDRDATGDRPLIMKEGSVQPT